MGKKKPAAEKPKDREASGEKEYLVRLGKPVCINAEKLEGEVWVGRDVLDTLAGLVPLVMLETKTK